MLQLAALRLSLSLLVQSTMSDPEMIEFSERDSTVRRTRAEQNQQQQQRDSDEEEAALNAPQSREHKPLMGESLAVILLLGFGFLLWIVVLISFQQLIISSSSPKHFSSVRARYTLPQSVHGTVMFTIVDYCVITILTRHYKNTVITW